MNKNIEVINKNLWAVNFLRIPLINEINYVLDEEIPAYEEFGRVTGEGILILNKDYPGFKILKEWMPKLMKKKDKQLNKEISGAKVLKDKTDWEVIYELMLQVELERRTKERGEK